MDESFMIYTGGRFCHRRKGSLGKGAAGWIEVGPLAGRRPLDSRPSSAQPRVSLAFRRSPEATPVLKARNTAKPLHGRSWSFVVCTPREGTEGLEASESQCDSHKIGRKYWL